MQIDNKTLLGRYRYDALNRLVANTPLAQADSQRFYLKDRLATEIQGAEQRSIMQHEDQLLAQQQRQSSTVETRLLATDQQRSVLNVIAAARRNPLAYTPYGHRNPQNGLLSLLSFNGERPDPVTGCYLLGNGYRAFNPVLMRFNSPDSWSPFGSGGLNSYAYCDGNPANRSDPTGHSPYRPPRIINQLAKVSNNSKAISRQPNNIVTSNKLSYGTRMDNITPLRDEIFGFTDFHQKKRRLTIFGHGTKNSNGNYEIYSKDGNLSSQELSRTLNSARIDYRYIRLAVCNSATGENSMASQVAAATKKPTLGYIGSVWGAPDPEHIQHLINIKNRSVRQKSNGTYTSNKTLEIADRNPFDENSQEYNDFEYRPVIHYPGRWINGVFYRIP